MEKMGVGFTARCLDDTKRDSRTITLHASSRITTLLLDVTTATFRSTPYQAAQLKDTSRIFRWSDQHTTRLSMSAANLKQAFVSPVFFQESLAVLASQSVLPLKSCIFQHSMHQTLS